MADAFALAEELHRDQTRKSTGIPYVSHLLAVTALVLEDGGRDDEAIAALLHDAAEDAGGRETLEAIRGHFGDRVALIVAACSDSMPGTGETKEPWEERKAAYLEELAGADASVLRVSLADKLHNGRTLLTDLARDGAGVWERFNAPPDRQAWYYGELLRLFEARLGTSAHLPELRGVVAGIVAAADQARASSAGWGAAAASESGQ